MASRAILSALVNSVVRGPRSPAVPDTALPSLGWPLFSGATTPHPAQCQHLDQIVWPGGDGLERELPVAGHWDSGGLEMSVKGVHVLTCTCQGKEWIYRPGKGTLFLSHLHQSTHLVDCPVAERGFKSGFPNLVLHGDHPPVGGGDGVCVRNPSSAGPAPNRIILPGQCRGWGVLRPETRLHTHHSRQHRAVESGGGGVGGEGTLGQTGPGVGEGVGRDVPFWGLWALPD